MCRVPRSSLSAQLACFTGIYESDTLVPTELRDALLSGVTELETNPPYGEADWHPGSNEQVLDLVHPSLFPLRYGKTRIYDVDENGAVSTTLTRAPDARTADHSCSEKYQ